MCKRILLCYTHSEKSKSGVVRQLSPRWTCSHAPFTTRHNTSYIMGKLSTVEIINLVTERVDSVASIWVTVNSLLFQLDFSREKITKQSIKSDKIIRNRLRISKSSPRLESMADPTDLYRESCWHCCTVRYFVQCHFNCFSLGPSERKCSTIHPSNIRSADDLTLDWK